jgi:predicted permease
MNILLPAVLPVALIIFIGFITAKTLAVQTQTLSQLTLFILSPALIIDSLYRTTLSFQSSVGLLFGFTLTSGAIYLFVKLISKITQLPVIVERAALATSLFPNNGNMGLPVSAFAFGAAGLERAVVYTIGSSILMFCSGPAIFRGKGIIDGIKLTLKLPLVWSIFLGLGLRLSSFKLPFQLDTSIQQLGEAAIPIALILLGMQLANTRLHFGIKEFLAAMIRLAIAPLIAYFVGITLHLANLDLQILVLQSAMPTAVTSSVMAAEFGGDKDFIAQTIVTSTLISFLTIPGILWLLSR